MLTLVQKPKKRRVGNQTKEKRQKFAAAANTLEPGAFVVERIVESRTRNGVEEFLV